MIAAIVTDAKSEYEKAIAETGYSNTDMFTTATAKSKCGFLDVDVVFIKSLDTAAKQANSGSTGTATHYH
jgi:hypothetical protein